MSATSVWKLGGAVAELASAPLGLRVDLAQPALGAGSLTLDGQAVAGRLWSWSPLDASPPRLMGAYTRGADLVAEYGSQENFPFHTQVYWRWEPPVEESVAALSLILSVRTHKLDTHPVYEVRSSFDSAVATLLRGDDGAQTPAVSFVGKHHDWSAVETVQPGDHVEEGGLSASDGGSLWRLFDLFMEKGVIRRAKLSVAFASPPLSQKQAAAVAAALRSNPTPLTV